MAKLNPRRRRQRQRYLAQGPKQKPQQVFSEPSEFNGDMALVIGLLRMKGYHIPQEAYKLAVEVPMEIARDKSPLADPKVKLRASNLLRMVIKDAKEIELMEAEIETLKGSNEPQEVFVREDESFFGNDAHQESHEATKRASQEGASEGNQAS